MNVRQCLVSIFVSWIRYYDCTFIREHEKIGYVEILEKKYYALGGDCPYWQAGETILQRIVLTVRHCFKEL